MTTNEILKLVEAGFTRVEIEAMDKGIKIEPAEKTEEIPAENEAVEVPAESPDVAKMIAEAMKPLQEELAKTVKMIQAANAANARQPEPTKMTVEDIVADFFGNGKGGGK